MEPKSEKNVAFRDWDKMGSEIGELGLWDDDEQPLPTNVMYPGAWRGGGGVQRAAVAALKCVVGSG